MDNQPPPAYDAGDAKPSAPVDVGQIDLGSKMPSAQEQLERLKLVAQKYELAGGAIAKMRRLAGYDIVVIADDSGSMNAAAHEPSKSDPFAKQITRWEELRDTVSIVVEVATCLDPDGIDIYFLNGPPAFNVHEPAEAAKLFLKKPNGYTPLSACVAKVLQDKLGRDPEKKILLVVFTDGEPNKSVQGTMRSDVEGFKKLLQTRNGYAANRCPVTLMACTDDDNEVAWMNELDDTAPNVDVLDDFLSEKKEVKAKQGGWFPFSVGDYVVKAMLGSIDPIYDNLDERKLSYDELMEYTGGREPAGYQKPSGCNIL